MDEMKQKYGNKKCRVKNHSESRKTFFALYHSHYVGATDCSQLLLI